MSSSSLIIALIAVIPTFSLAAYVWLKVLCDDDELLSFSNVSIIHNNQGFYD